MDILDEKQETLLYKVTSKRHAKLIILLKNNNSNTEIRNLDGTVPLLNAIYRRRESVVQLLLKHIGKKDFQDSKSAFLYTVVQAANSKIIILLLKVGIDINIKDVYGETAFSYIKRKYERSIYKALLNKGADINVRGTDGTILLYKIATINDVASI